MVCYRAVFFIVRLVQASYALTRQSFVEFLLFGGHGSVEEDFALGWYFEIDVSFDTSQHEGTEEIVKHRQHFRLAFFLQDALLVVARLQQRRVERRLERRQVVENLGQQKVEE